MALWALAGIPAASVHYGTTVQSNGVPQILSETIMTDPLPSSWNANLGFGLAVLAAVLWGLTYCLDERVLASLSVFKLYFLHCLCGVIVAGGILLFQGHSPAGLFRFDTAKAGLPLVGLTLLTATAAALAILGSIQLLGANKSAVLEISYPLFVALFSVWFFNGGLQLPVVVGGVFIFIGSAIIVLAK
jgi:drug/metabolite transporter (DMT)-like permease